MITWQRSDLTVEPVDTLHNIVFSRRGFDSRNFSSRAFTAERLEKNRPWYTTLGAVVVGISLIRAMQGAVAEMPT